MNSQMGSKPSFTEYFLCAVCFKTVFVISPEVHKNSVWQGELSQMLKEDIGSHTFVSYPRCHMLANGVSRI